MAIQQSPQQTTNTRLPDKHTLPTTTCEKLCAARVPAIIYILRKWTLSPTERFKGRPSDVSTDRAI